jgi:hypothetical protein
MTRLCTVMLLFLQSSGFSQSGETTSIGGYGELHYTEPDGSRRGELDFTRFVVHLSHAFDQRVSLYSEVEIEHTRVEAGEDRGGEIALEQAFLDYRFTETFGVRAGIVLIPVGLINIYHEPPAFNGVERPNFDAVIIPTTWREAGAGVFGTLGENAHYQVYVVAGLDARGFSADNGIRGGRQQGFRSNTANPSCAGRLDFSPLANLQLGASFFAGNSSADNDTIGSAFVSVVSGDLRFSAGDFTMQSVFAFAHIGDTEKINGAYGAGVASRLYGFTVETAYNILPLFSQDAEGELQVFARLEQYDTQAATTGFAPQQQFDRTDIVVGATFKPVYNVAFKCDYVFLNNRLNAGADRNTGQFNLGLGYYFF